MFTCDSICATFFCMSGLKSMILIVYTPTQHIMRSVMVITYFLALPGFPHCSDQKWPLPYTTLCWRRYMRTHTGGKLYKWCECVKRFSQLFSQTWFLKEDSQRHQSIWMQRMLQEFYPLRRLDYFSSWIIKILSLVDSFWLVHIDFYHVQSIYNFATREKV